MNKDWSEKNKKMQTLIAKEATFDEGLARHKLWPCFESSLYRE